MVIDTSALLAILQGEAETRAFIDAIRRADSPVISTASVLESSIVIESRFGPEGVRDLDLFLLKAGITQVAVDAEHAALGRQAYRKYGKGRHPAGLNFGDCFAYALARSRGEALLFKGEDFSKTDLKAVELP